MKLSDILGMSLMNLWRRKIRTILTVLGVIIGTASIVVMLSLGLGLKNSMMESVGSAGGLTEIVVYSEGEAETEDKLLGDNTIDTFMEIENVEEVQPQLSFSMPIQAGKYECYANVVGVTDEYLSKIELEEGGELPQTGSTLSMVVGNQVLCDFYDSLTGVCPYWENDELPDIDLMKTTIMGGIEKTTYSDSDMGGVTEDSGVELADPMFAVTPDDSEDGSGADFFGDGDGEESFPDEESDFSFGQNEYDNFEDSMSYSAFTSDMKRVPLKVSGVVAGGVESYSDYSYGCYVRIQDLKDFLHKNYSANEVIMGQPVDRNGKPYRDLKYSPLIVRVNEADNVEAVLQTIQEMGYYAEANKEWLEQIEKEFMLIEAVLGGIGAVSMLVAAISIANTMTMSIYERTKEIGIMKVLGCGLASIRGMFLSEAAFIGFLGGVAGVGLSCLLSLLLNYFAPALAGEMLLETGSKISDIPPWLVLMAIVFSTLIGMIAGFFPANQATKLSPLAAIRNE